jgi:hypothetical protein
MKVCPECGTQYEDHVPTCIADGVELVPAAGAEPTQILPARPAPPAPPPPAGPRLSVILLVALAAGVGTVALVTVVVAQLVLNRPSPPPPSRPVPVAAPAPVAPREAPPIDVVLVSEPLGAKVYENDQFVCETPCTVQHPPHAPLPRSFVFKAAGHRDEMFEMTEARGPITVQLSRVRSVPAPAGPPNAVPRPTIGRDR